MKKAFLWAAFLFAPLVGHAAAVGTMFGDPYIYGGIRPGDYEKAQRDFAKGLAKPLDLKVDADSHSFETMRIGLLLAEQRPALRVRKQCIGPCASFLLTSGSSVRIDKGTLIAFSSADEYLAMIFDRLRTNPDEIFIENSEISQLSRARFLERFKLRANTALLMRDAADHLMPAPALKFLRAISLPAKLEKVAFDEHQYTVNGSFTGGQCIWWVPDASGVAQLGINAAGYQAVDRASAAKALKIDFRLVYVGPMVDPMPEGGLCPLR